MQTSFDIIDVENEQEERIRKQAIARESHDTYRAIVRLKAQNAALALGMEDVTDGNISKLAKECRENELEIHRLSLALRALEIREHKLLPQGASNAGKTTKQYLEHIDENLEKYSPEFRSVYAELDNLYGQYGTAMETYRHKWMVFYITLRVVNPDLTIRKISKMLSVSHTTIYKAINEYKDNTLLNVETLIESYRNRMITEFVQRNVMSALHANSVMAAMPHKDGVSDRRLLFQMAGLVDVKSVQIDNTNNLQANALGQVVKAHAPHDDDTLPVLQSLPDKDLFTLFEPDLEGLEVENE